MKEKIKFPKPDYKYWARAETWSQQKAAFLLHGIDPEKYTDVKLEKESRVEFEEVRKTYRILRSVPWRERHPGYYFANVGVHPVAIICEAVKKDLHIPAVLRKLVAKRYQQELDFRNEINETDNQEEKPSSDQDQELSPRERNNYLKAIAVLITLLLDEKMKSSRNASNKYSASQISRLMLDKAESLNLDTNGIKSFDRKITEALELLNQETNLAIDL